MQVVLPGLPLADTITERLVTVYYNATERRMDITSIDRSNPGQQLLKWVQGRVKEQSIGIQNRIQ